MNEPTLQPLAEHSKTDLEWTEIIEEWRRSGENMAEWVRRQSDFSYDQFAKARRRLSPEDTRKGEFLESKTTWSSVAVALPSSTVDLHYRDYKLVISSGFDRELVQELLEVLADAN
ncbi:hypothetical protein DV702_16625 [Sporosarcina sp. PTS2304]|uniref:IS66 family insertion sequence element accessory protein TnpA n=1 Tax=Sporosarcina sp. PTS2304 TaxID=2283194 RepID=UPI000E0D58DD|nr:hypothetical protein [Sporosarcina sp. PTS2304]AXH98380.1 hypothetical protein DV702_00865 [Sporosarcina sp. PTS2304]AXH99265.1 hypothetical protein DV702_05630 [Sporosarcina sp. PTS2304]AXI00924.1 hypothetical protein DV702_15125 [Sporosarcina sp. PTS2304]AXI01144.1 hypothetical protein DV702_16315 [Sporosarcina sp. PTS2304]AXI01202.1 hypothetical protein DV702_16625 [Sporosarcina sp. PTS2304]